jgi:DNA polymerase-3 subunit delta
MAVPSIGDLKPVYLIFGDEELLLQHAVRRLRDRLSKVADLDFNYDVFEGDSTDADTIVAAANTLPFMSEKRLIVVHDVDKMPTAGLARLAEYSADPAEHACLVLVARKLARNTKLFKAVEAVGVVAEYKSPRPSEYPASVVAMFEARGKRVDAEAATTLVRAVGRNLRKLETEVDKIVAFSGDAVSLTRDDIAGVMSVVAPVSVFEFLDALCTRDCRVALKALADLLAQGESVHGVHAMSVRQVRNLLSVRALLDRGLKPFQVGREIGVREEWRVRKTVAQAGRFETGDLVAALRAAAAAELAMKTGDEPRLAFERWVIGLCRVG